MAIGPTSSITGAATSTAGSASSAISNASSGSATAQAASSLDDLSDQIAALQQKADQNRLEVRDSRKDTNDVQIEKNMTARDIGPLRDHKPRLNLFSALSAKDGVDVFKFKVASTAATKLGVL